MRKILITSLIVLSACSARSSNEDGDPVGDRVGDWDATLASRNNSTVRGTAKAQSVGLGAGANISINGAQSGAFHPWHIHTGTCATGGPILGNASNYPVLQVGADGTASANATIGSALNEQTRYHVNVHRSPTDMGTIVACGDLDND